MIFEPKGCEVWLVSTHSRPKAADSVKSIAAIAPQMFQHTAARRRLSKTGGVKPTNPPVSTHSRPKAADH